MVKIPFNAYFIYILYKSFIEDWYGTNCEEESWCKDDQRLVWLKDCRQRTKAVFHKTRCSSILEIHDIGFVQHYLLFIRITHYLVESMCCYLQWNGPDVYPYILVRTIRMIADVLNKHDLRRLILISIDRGQSWKMDDCKDHDHESGDVMVYNCHNECIVCNLHGNTI